MNTVNLILDLVIIAGLIFIIMLQRKARKLDKKIAENWKTICELRKAGIKTVEEAKEMLGITGIKLEEKGE